MGHWNSRSVAKKAVRERRTIALMETGIIILRKTPGVATKFHILVPSRDPMTACRLDGELALDVHPMQAASPGRICEDCASRTGFDPVVLAVQINETLAAA